MNYQKFRKLKNKLTFFQRRSKFVIKNVEVKIVADDNDFIPKYQTEGAACADLVCNLNTEFIILHPNETFLFDCGFSMELPNGWEAQIRPRSGMSSKEVIVLNSPGIIDSDYRGRIRVAMKNCSQNKITFTNKQRIAQISVNPVTQFNWVISKELSKTKRNDGGFGSTGQ